ncbi:MAG: NUDIX domain-containing protein [Candidatus Sericytochromatia bacterium]
MKEIQEEVSAGGVLIRINNGIKEALVIKVRHYGYEVPKGHPEGIETLEEAATRELCEETSLRNTPIIGISLGDLDYTFTYDNKLIHKKVYYYSFTTKNEPIFGVKPLEVKELRWINQDDLINLSLVNEKLRDIIKKSLI